MTILTRLALVCAVVLTSLGLGTARGQMRAGDEVALCAGGAIAVVHVGADGRPERQTHLCPDMAPALLAGWDAPPPMPARPAGRAEALRPAAVPQAGPQRVMARQARGPPVRARA